MVVVWDEMHAKLVHGEISSVRGRDWAGVN